MGLVQLVGVVKCPGGSWTFAIGVYSWCADRAWHTHHSFHFLSLSERIRSARNFADMLTRFSVLRLCIVCILVCFCGIWLSWWQGSLWCQVGCGVCCLCPPWHCRRVMLTRTYLLEISLIKFTAMMVLTVNGMVLTWEEDNPNRSEFTIKDSKEAVSLYSLLCHSRFLPSNAFPH